MCLALILVTSVILVFADLEGVCLPPGGEGGSVRGGEGEGGAGGGDGKWES